MMKRMDDMLSAGRTWAVVGATAKKEKYGYKIFRMLKDRGYTAYAVNPFYDEIDGEMCYNALMDLPEQVDCVSIVVAPERAMDWLDAIRESGIRRVWFQPGTFTGDVLEKAESLGLETVYGHCVLMELKARM